MVASPSDYEGKSDRDLLVELHGSVSRLEGGFETFCTEQRLCNTRLQEKDEKIDVRLRKVEEFKATCEGASKVSSGVIAFIVSVVMGVIITAVNWYLGIRYGGI